MNGLAPAFLSDILDMYPAGPSAAGLPKDSNKNTRGVRLKHCGPSLWTSVPEDLRDSTSVVLPKRQLRRFFSLAFR